MNPKNLKFAALSILMVILVFLFLKFNETQEYPIQENNLVVDEAILQKQLREILVKGDEAGCDTINNTLYSSGCHKMFNKRNARPAIK